MAAVPTIECDPTTGKCNVPQHLIVVVQRMDDHEKADSERTEGIRESVREVRDGLTNLRTWIIGALFAVVLSSLGIIVTLLHAASQVASKGVHP